jgi:soluble lytic murein transglycosylase-like protein
MIAGMSLRPRTLVYALAVGGGLLALWLILRGGSSGLARDPEKLSAGLIENDAPLHRGIDAWRAEGQATPPDEVSDRAQYLQQVARLLATDPGLAEGTIARLPPNLATQTRDLTIAYRDLRKLSGGGSAPDFETQPPRPLDELQGYYQEAQSKYGIDASYLAAINLVETDFGRVSSQSVAGAQGPMQFIPSTWRLYGGGGDIHDPHDAILGAANLLSHSGAPGSYSRALLAYNPSSLYVDAVQRYAGVIARDPDAIYTLYSWEPG